MNKLQFTKTFVGKCVFTVVNIDFVIQSEKQALMW